MKGAGRRGAGSTAVATLLVALFVSEPGRADDPGYLLVPARLTYRAPKSCPDESFFRTALARHTRGLDPFEADAKRTVEVTITRNKGGRYEVTIVALDEEGKDLGPWDHPLSWNCEEAVQGAAFVAADAVKDFDAARKANLAKAAAEAAKAAAAPAPPSPPPPAPAPKAPERPSRSEIPPDDLPSPPPPPKPPLPASKPPIGGRMAVMPVRIDARPGTSPTYGLSAELGFVGARYFSLAAQFHAVPSATATGPSAGRLKTALFTGGLLACVRPEVSISKLLTVVFPVCLSGETGGVELQTARVLSTAVGVSLSGGGRIGGEVAIGRAYISVLADLLWAMQPTPDQRFGGSGLPAVSGYLKGPAGGGGVAVGYSF